MAVELDWHGDEPEAVSAPRRRGPTFARRSPLSMRWRVLDQGGRLRGVVWVVSSIAVVWGLLLILGRIFGIVVPGT